MTNSNLKSTNYVCLECGSVSSVKKSTDNNKSSERYLYCYKCMAITRNYGIIDMDEFMSSESSNSKELFVKDLIKNGKENSQKGRNRIFKKILKK